MDSPRNKTGKASALEMTVETQIKPRTRGLRWSAGENLPRQRRGHGFSPWQGNKDPTWPQNGSLSAPARVSALEMQQSKHLLKKQANKADVQTGYERASPVSILLP